MFRWKGGGGINYTCLYVKGPDKGDVTSISDVKKVRFRRCIGDRKRGSCSRKGEDKKKSSMTLIQRVRGNWGVPSWLPTGGRYLGGPGYQVKKLKRKVYMARQQKDKGTLIRGRIVGRCK